MRTSPEHCLPPEDRSGLEGVVNYRLCQITLSKERSSAFTPKRTDTVPDINDIIALFAEVGLNNLISNRFDTEVNGARERWFLKHRCGCMDGEVTIERRVMVGDGMWDDYEYMFFPLVFAPQHYVLSVDYKHLGRESDPLNRCWQYVAPRLVDGAK